MDNSNQPHPKSQLIKTSDQVITSVQVCVNDDTVGIFVMPVDNTFLMFLRDGFVFEKTAEELQLTKTFNDEQFCNKILFKSYGYGRALKNLEDGGAFVNAIMMHLAIRFSNLANMSKVQLQLVTDSDKKTAYWVERFKYRSSNDPDFIEVPENHLMTAAIKMSYLVDFYSTNTIKH